MQPRLKPLNIRSAIAADVDEMIRIGRACPTAPQWSETQYCDLFRAAQPRRMLVLIMEDASGTTSEPHCDVCGFLVASYVPQNNSQQEWELETIAVDPSAGRRGLGTQLLRELITHVAAQGGGSISLEVRASNSAARGLYEKCGFSHAGLRKRYYANPTEDAILYRTNVQPA